MHADVLVINLTRFGDLLQCRPLLHDLEAAGHKPGLVCLDNFAGALPLMGIEACWPIPGAKLLAQASAQWPSAMSLLLDLARRIHEEARHDCVINLTPTLPGRLLAKLLRPKSGRMLGFGLDDEGFGVNHGLWSSFLSGSTLHRQNAPFNLADMFRKLGVSTLLGHGHSSSNAHESDSGHKLEHHYAHKQTHGHPPIFGAGRFTLCASDPAAENHAAALLTAAPPTHTGFVAFQLGASEARRQWPAASFAALGERLTHERDIYPVLLGSPGERPLAEAYAAHARTPFIDAVGATDILQLAALLRRMRLLVTNDTGTMHLAAGLGLPSLALFTATAQPWDTGPYLPGCCCLEPALSCHPCPYNQPCPHGHACLARISPESVGDLALAHLDGKGWSAGCSQRAQSEARIWLTETDHLGYAGLRCISGHEHEDRSLWLMQQRSFWGHFLDTPPDSSANAPFDATAPVSDANYGCSDSLRIQVLPTLTQAARLMALLVEQSGLVGKSPQAGRLFLLNCERVQSLLDACQPLASLALFWRELCRQYGGRMDALTQYMAILSDQLQAWAARLESCGPIRP